MVLVEYQPEFQNRIGSAVSHETRWQWVLFNNLIWMKVVCVCVWTDRSIVGIESSWFKIDEILQRISSIT